METIQHDRKLFNLFPIMFSLLLAGFIGLFFETALNMAFSDLMRIFDIDAATVQWLTTGYLLTIGVLVPVSAILIQSFSTRTLFTTSVGFSIIGTLVAALAANFGFLLAGRILQAAGTGLLLPLMYNIVLVIIPTHKRGAAMGLIGLVMMSSLALGPAISGLITQTLAWQWIFWLALPFFGIALASGIMYMENISAITKPKLDVASILLSTIGFGGMVFGFSSAGKGLDGWSSPLVLFSLIIGGIALVLFSLRQLYARQPIMNLRAFKYPMFTLGTLMVVFNMMLILTVMLLLPIYLQDGLAHSAFTAGLILLPGGILNGVMAPVNGRLLDTYGPKWLVIPGLAVAALSLWFFSNMTTSTPIVIIIGLHMCLMLGTSMVMMPAQTNGLNQLPPELYPDGSAIINTMQQAAGAIGTAVAATILTVGQHHYLGDVTDPSDPVQITASLTAGAQNAFVFAMAVSLIGLIIAFYIKRVDVNE